MAQPLVVRWYFDPADGIARNSKTGAKLTKTENKIKRVYRRDERPVNSAKGGRVYAQDEYAVIVRQRELAKAVRVQGRSLRAIGRNANTALKVVTYGIPQESIDAFPRYRQDDPRSGAQAGQFRVGNSTDSVVKAYNRVMAASAKFPMNKTNRAIMNRIYNQEMKAAVAAAPDLFEAQRANFQRSPAERRRAAKAAREAEARRNFEANFPPPIFEEFIPD